MEDIKNLRELILLHDAGENYLSCTYAVLEYLMNVTGNCVKDCTDQFNLLEILSKSMIYQPSSIIEEIIEKINIVKKRLIAELGLDAGFQKESIQRIKETLKDRSLGCGQIRALLTITTKRGETIGLSDQFICTLNEGRVAEQFIKMGDDMKSSIQTATKYAKDFLKSYLPFIEGYDDGRYQYRISGNAYTEYSYDGRSVGLAAFLAFCSANMGLEIPLIYAVTGEVDCSGNTVRVEALREKLTFLFDNHPYIATVFVPDENGDDIPKTLIDTHRVKRIKHVKEAFELIFGKEPYTLKSPILFHNRDHIDSYMKNTARNAARNGAPGAANWFEFIIKEFGNKQNYESQYRRLYCYHRLINYYLHLGRLDKVKGCIDEAENTIAFMNAYCGDDYSDIEKPNFADEIERFRNSLSTYYIDIYDYAHAEQLLKNQLQKIAGKLNNREKERRTKIMGSLGQLYTFQGRYSEAEDCLKQLVDHLECMDKGYVDLPRECFYLGFLYLKNHSFSDAREALLKGLAINREIPEKIKEFYLSEGEKKSQLTAMQKNALFLHYGLCKYYYLDKNFPESINHAQEGIRLCEENTPSIEHYSKGLMLRFMACSKWNHGNRDESISDFKSAIHFLEGFHSPNIDIIANTARLDLALHYLEDGVQKRNEIKEQIDTSLRNFVTFMDMYQTVKIYFVDDVKQLQTIDLDHAPCETIRNTLKQVATHIPYF